MFNTSSDNIRRLMDEKSIVFNFPEVKLSNVCLSLSYVEIICSSDVFTLFFSFFMFSIFSPSSCLLRNGVKINYILFLDEMDF